MNEECGKFEELSNGPQPESAARLEHHLRECPQCRAQLRADRQLRGFAGRLNRPALSPHFGRNLQARLKSEAQSRRKLRRRLRIMQAYWLAAALASLLSVLACKWPTDAHLLASTVAFVVGMSLLVLPVATLSGCLRAGLLDLIFTTLDEMDEAQTEHHRP
jgi:hypothetical protein